jgi:hypothetical protein
MTVLGGGAVEAVTGKVRIALATFAAYTVVVLWLTWPLAANLGTHLPRTTFICDFDLRQMVWALSWQTHALMTAPARYFEANIYYPTPHALLYADAGFGALPYFAPTFLLTGNPTLAANVMFLGSVALTATLLHLLVARWTGLVSAGVVASGTFLATRWVLWTWAPAAPNYAVLQALPVIVYLAAARERPFARTALLTVLVALHGMANPYFAAAVLAPLGVLAGLRLVSPSGRRSGRSLLGVIAIATLALCLVYGPYAWIRSVEPNLRYQTWWGFVRDVTMNVPWGLVMHPLRPTAIPFPMLDLIGLGLVALCIPRAGRTDGERTAWRHGFLWAAVGIVLSLTPTVRVGDDLLVRLPHADLIDRFPGLDLLRDPHRMGVSALFGLAILAGASFAEIVRRLDRVLTPRDARLLRGLAAGALVVVSAGLFWAPISLRVVPWPPQYPIMPAAIPGSAVMAELRKPGGPVLQVPASPDGPFEQQLAAHGVAVFESIGHWRPILNGYGGFFPAAFVEHMRLAARLPDADALAELRRQTDVELVLVRGDVPGVPALHRWEALARAGGGDGLRFVTRDGADLLFAVDGAVARR